MVSASNQGPCHKDVGGGATYGNPLLHLCRITGSHIFLIYLRTVFLNGVIKLRATNNYNHQHHQPTVKEFGHFLTHSGSLSNILYK
jgi:hypothetical protein